MAIAAECERTVLQMTLLWSLTAYLNEALDASADTNSVANYLARKEFKTLFRKRSVTSLDKTQAIRLRRTA